MIERGLLVIATLVWACTVQAQVTLDAVPGGLVEIPLTPVDDQPPPEAYFGQKRILVMEFGSRWAGLVGLPLSLVPGTYVIHIRRPESEEPDIREFTVYPRRREGDPLVQIPSGAAKPPRIELAWRESLDARLPLAPPVPGEALPTFGRYRRASQSETAYVDFVTFDVPSDTAVAAPDNGLVAAVQAHESGTYIWIDHGMSLFTCIGPVTSATVEQGEPVEAGQGIGEIILEDAPEPGPATLYWSVYLNGTAVNPFLIAGISGQTARGHGLARDPARVVRPAPDRRAQPQPGGSSSYLAAASPASYQGARELQ